MGTESKNQKRTSRITKSNEGGTRKRSANAGMGASLFEVSSEDVESLKDDELRELVARLCKATLIEAGLSATCVTWGGDQREPDGGIDVRVQLHDKGSLPDSRWLRWRSVGFQVKATEMPPAKIKKEMCPNDSLQSSIQELLQVGGAYIIAARDSVADQRYKERVAAMLECAVGLLQDENSGCVDYYDSRRLADWASEYPTVVAWVHNKTQGGALHGWVPYGQWATSKWMRDGKYPPFLLDERARFIDPWERSFNLIDGIDGLAASLTLIALSGYLFCFIRETLWVYCIMISGLMGVLVAYLYFNLFLSECHKKKIFMGDSGSLTLGYVLAFLFVKFSMNNTDVAPFYSENRMLICSLLRRVPYHSGTLAKWPSLVSIRQESHPP